MLHILLMFLCLLLTSQTVPSMADAQKISLIARDFDTPWAVEQLPNGALLVTERGGQLIFVHGLQRHVVSGTPDVAAQGQGGLLDVTLPRDFSHTRDVFLTYSKPSENKGASTALASGKLSLDGTQLTDVKDLFVSAPASSGGRHFGSRVVEAPDGTLLVTIGDRGDRPSAQDRGMHNGSIIRVNRDGSVPNDNPFVHMPGAYPEIWSFGHRNPQGAGFDAQGRLWTSEHGAKGGDEVNRIKKGANFGWPVISFGRHYSGAKIGEGTAKPGMEQPQYYWDPSIAPSGLLVYSGKLNPDWTGDILIGSLKFDFITRLNGTPLREIEQIKTRETERVRDIIEAQDGTILFVSEGNGAVYRLTP